MTFILTLWTLPPGGIAVAVQRSSDRARRAVASTLLDRHLVQVAEIVSHSQTVSWLSVCLKQVASVSRFFYVIYSLLS